MAAPNILPSSIPMHRKMDSSLSAPGLNWIYIFCASCGADGGRVLENEYDFAFYLCNDCAEKYGKIDGAYMEPDAVFWEKLKNAQMEKYGRELSPHELQVELEEQGSVISKLAKEKKVR